jgi:hypothetical protein
MHALAIYNRYSRTAFAALAFVCAASVFLYGTFLLLAVDHAARHAHAASSLQELKAKLSTLENQYLAATQAITPSYAARLGYVRPSSVETVYATPPAQTLTLNTTPAR